MKTFLNFLEENSNLVNIGSKKYPLYAKKSSKLETKHESGATHHINGFKPPEYPKSGSSTNGDTTIHHNDEAYSHSGKTGKNFKTGEKSYEYKTNSDKRVWVTKTGHVIPD